MESGLRIAIFTGGMFMATLTTDSQAKDCATFFGPEVITGRMEVSTFHHKGEIAPSRVMDLRWPRKGAMFPPKIEGDQAPVPEMNRLLRMEIGSGVFDRKRPFDENSLEIMLNAADYYPVYSQLALLARVPPERSRLLHRSDGTTYYSSEGYVFTGNDLDGGWRGVIYPDVFIPDDDRFDLYIREDAQGQIDGVLRCTGYHSATNPPCKVIVKREPVFAEGSFLRSNLPRLDLILTRMTDTLACAF